MNLHVISDRKPNDYKELVLCFPGYTVAKVSQSDWPSQGLTYAWDVLLYKWMTLACSHRLRHLSERHSGTLLPCPLCRSFHM